MSGATVQAMENISDQPAFCKGKLSAPLLPDIQAIQACVTT